MKDIALFGGTFDPVHRAHLSLATEAMRQLGLDEVWFLVTPQNPWKRDSRLSPDADRLNMVRLAIEGIEGLVASDYEFHLPQPSYTYQTLRHLRHDRPHDMFTLLIGGDNWAAFDHWAEYREILSHHPIAVYPRPGARLETPDAIAATGFSPHIITAPMMDVSSTEIRRRTAEGISTEGMINPNVEEYIRERGMYKKK